MAVTGCRLNDNRVNGNLFDKTPKFEIANSKSRVSSPIIDITFEEPEHVEAYSLTTNLSSCQDNPSWQSYSGSVTYQLREINAVNEVFIRTRLNNGVVSDCKRSEITLDVVPPTPVNFLPFPTFTSLRSSVNNTPIFNWTSSIDDDSGTIVTDYEIRILNATDNSEVLAWQPHTRNNSINGLTILDQNQHYYAELRARDEAGNYSIPTKTESWGYYSTNHFVNPYRADIISFNNPYQFPADLNADGKMDVIISNTFGSEAVTVLINSGGLDFSDVKVIKGFQSCVAYLNNTSTRPTIDFNNDGYPDCLAKDHVVLMHENYRTSKIFLESDIGSSYKFTFSDFDSDGDLDFLVYFIGDGYYLFENDSLYFRKSLVRSSTDTPNNFFHIDVNGDGIKDLLVSQGTNGVDVGWYDLSPSPADSNFQLITNAHSFPNLLAGELDGQPGGDFVLSSTPGTGGWIFLNNGSGAYSSTQFETDSVFTIQLVDMNDDGDLDLIYTDATPGTHYFQNNGSGGFSSHSSRGAFQSTQFHVSDLNGDGKKDILTHPFEYPLVNAGDDDLANFIPMSDLLISNVVPSNNTGIELETLHFETIDFDGDGDLDIIHGATTSIHIYENDGAGNFLVRQVFADGLATRDLKPYDMDGDGNMDLVVQKAAIGSQSYKLYVLYNDGNYSFTQYEIISNMPKQAQYFDVADVNEDGRTDIIAITGTYSNSTLNLLIDDLTAGTSQNRSYTSSSVATGIDSVTKVTITDLDGINHNDIVVTNNDSAASYVTTYINNGSEVFAANNIKSGGSSGFFTHRVLDLDGDTDMDIVYIQEFGNVRWMENNGSGSFTDHTTAWAYDSWCDRIDLMDIDGDGDIDFVTFDEDASNTAQLMLYKNSGDNTNFTGQQIHIGLGKDLANLQFGDINGDGNIDIIHASQGGVSLPGLARHIMWTEVHNF